jgi:Polyketide cyclase / dehydrase and lipid transport
MFPLKRLALAVIGIVALAAMGGWAFPRQVHVERSIVIDAAPPAVFALVNGFTSFSRWSPWYERDRSMRPVPGSPRSGVGARLAWDGDPAGVGAGTQEIVESRPYELVRTAMDFGVQGSATGRFRLVPEGRGTRLTWSFDTDLGLNPVSRYFGPFFDRTIGPDFERGLARLKTLAERSVSRPASGPG